MPNHRVQAWQPGKANAYKRKLFENRDNSLLTVDDLAEWLRVSPKTIYGWIYKGELKPLKLGPRLVRFKREEVAEWISKRK